MKIRYQDLVNNAILIVSLVIMKVDVYHVMKVICYLKIFIVWYTAQKVILKMIKFVINVRKIVFLAKMKISVNVVKNINFYIKGNVFPNVLNILMLINLKIVKIAQWKVKIAKLVLTALFV